MHFTREPVIETIITPKDGYRLALKPTKGSGEEFFVDMIEVITFGKSSFYRSLEKPKSFVIPATDYEVIEVREARVAIKSAAVEKVKIAGGKQRSDDEEKGEKKSRAKRTRKKKVEEPKKEKVEVQEAPAEPKESREKRVLIPPPATLISDSMRSKEEEAMPALEPNPDSQEDS